MPPRNNQPINIEIYGAPQLAVEIASTTLGDDLGRKRLLYERLGVQEYWVVNVALSTVIAFAVYQWWQLEKFENHKFYPALH